MPEYIYVCDDDDNLYADARVLTNQKIVERIKYKSTVDGLAILQKIQEEFNYDEREYRRNNIQSIIELARRFPKGFFTDSYDDFGFRD